MKNLVYYPTFETQNETWLKYALLYIDNFSPIIPIRGRSQLSNQFKLLERHTDLVRSKPPEDEQGRNASIKAIELIERIRLDPANYASLFNDANLIGTWTNPANWTSALYHEKFTDNFLVFCLNNHFGSQTDSGILLAESLAGIYMTLLAEEVAFDNDASPITDVPALDKLSTFLRTRDVQQENRLNAASIVINNYLPENIENIVIERFIEFRQQPRIEELRHSFNETLESFYNAVEQNFDPFSYAETIRKINKNMFEHLTEFAGQVTEATLGAMILLSGGHAATDAILQQLIGSGLILKGGVGGVKEARRAGGANRKARKFLTKVRNL